MKPAAVNPTLIRIRKYSRIIIVMTYVKRSFVYRKLSDRDNTGLATAGSTELVSLDVIRLQYQYTLANPNRHVLTQIKSVPIREAMHSL